jgi:hypothetical protein
MASTVSADLDYRPSYLAAGIASVLVLVLYLVTLAPSTAMWDTSEYIAAAYILGLPHPPGNPFFVLIGKFFSLLPIAGSIAARVNILAAVSSAVSAGMWFLITERVLVSWFPQRWQRIVTVWSQSVVNEKVYTVSLVGLALVAWITVRWCDEPDGPKADRLLVLVAYLLGLGYSNHMAGMLAAPAVAIAVLIRRPRTLVRWKLLLAGAGAALLGITPFATQPIRAAFFPSSGRIARSRKAHGKRSSTTSTASSTASPPSSSARRPLARRSACGGSTSSGSGSAMRMARCRPCRSRSRRSSSFWGCSEGGYTGSGTGDRSGSSVR